MKRMRSLLFIVPFSISMVMLALKALTPARLDANGMLKEPFYLLPLAYLFLIIGLVGVVIYFITRPKSEI